MSRLHLIGLGLAAVAASAAAQDTPTQRIEINASDDSDTDKRRREPVAKSIYGREELDRYGDVSVTDVLKRLPGVTLSGGNPRLRGLGAGYTLILVNGEPAPPGFSLDNLSPAMVERIEVTKGPTAEHSAQAVAGTINIVLRQQVRKGQRELRLGVGYNAWRPGPSLNLVWSESAGALSATVPLSLYRWRGRNGSESKRQTLGTDGEPQALHLLGRDDWWGGGASTNPRLVWKVDDTLSVDAQAQLQRSEFRNGGTLVTEVLEGLAPPSVDDEYRGFGHWQSMRGTLAVTRKGAGGTRLEARVGAQRSDSRSHQDFDGHDAAGAQTIERSTDSESHERGATSSGKWTQALGEAQQLATGWDLEQRRRDERRSVLENGLPQLAGFDGEPFHARITRMAAWVQDEWELSPQWSTYLGLRAERIDTRSTGSDGTLSSRSQVVTPLWHVNFKPRVGQRDLVRASLTRSYRAPELSQLMARPSVNTSYPVSGPNTELSPDRVGNPALKPELATGLDIAYERYLPGGGVVSVGLFHRRLTGLMRNRITLEVVDWSPAPRWVSRPANLPGARSTGVEVEMKGKASELFGLTQPWAPDWSLRASASAYRSQVDDIPGPDNRLEGQQPWNATLGADRQKLGDPLSFGFSLAFTPGYAVQQTVAQRLDQGRARTLDAYVGWAFSREAMLRLSVGNAQPLPQDTQVTVTDAAGQSQRSASRRYSRSWLSAGLTLRF